MTTNPEADSDGTPNPSRFGDGKGAPIRCSMSRRSGGREEAAYTRANSTDPGAYRVID